MRDSGEVGGRRLTDQLSEFRPEGAKALQAPTTLEM